MKILSNWRSVKLWETQLEQQLHREYSLRSHGLLIGTVTLLLMWAVSQLQLMAGSASLALRHAITLGVGYAGYLLILRFWARRLIDRDTGMDIEPLDLPGDLPGSGSPAAPALRSGGGGDFKGGGATGHFDKPTVSAPGAGIGDIATALDAASSLDEGAVVVVPVVAIFLIGTAVVGGAGALAMVFFGVDALLAVAVEVAFSFVAARAAVRVAREGWVMAAVRLTWKPLLGALFCAVALGAMLDHFVPQAQSLPQAVRLLLSR